MRIFTAVRHANNPGSYFGHLWSGNFYPALARLGHEVVESQVDLEPASLFMDFTEPFTCEELDVRARITEGILAELLVAHRQAPIDLFISYFYAAHFDPAAFDQIRAAGIPSVNYYCNSIYQFDLVAPIAGKVDFSWHAEKPARDSYLAVGANPIWVQMGADPRVYCPQPGYERAADAVFVGQRYADRDRWMAALVRAGVPVSIYGPGWGAKPAAAATAVNGATIASNGSTAATNGSTAAVAPREDVILGRYRPRAGTAASYCQSARTTLHNEGVWRGAVRLARQWRYRRQSRQLDDALSPHARGPISFREIAKVFGSHDVVLNFSNVWADGATGSKLVPHVRLRDFEAPMCGACYLTGYTEEIEEFYELGKEIDAYRTPEELVDKTRFYLANQAAAARLREAGCRRARRDHSWDRRFVELFEKIGLAT